MLLLSSGPKFPAHLRVRIPDTIFFNSFNYPSSWFSSSSSSSNQIETKGSIHLTLDQVHTTLMVKIRSAEDTLQQHITKREGVSRTNSSPISTPPTVKIACTGPALLANPSNTNMKESQNSGTLLLTSEAFEEIGRRWNSSEVEKANSLPRCIQLLKVKPETGVSYITCLVQPGFAKYSVQCCTYKIPLCQRLGLVASKSPSTIIKEDMKRLSTKNSVAIRLKRSIQGLATQIGKTQGRNTSKTTTTKLHGLVLEFIVTEDAHVDLIRVLGSHFRGDKPSWSDPNEETKEDKRKKSNRSKQKQKNSKDNDNDNVFPNQTQDDLLAAALMKKLYSESPINHSERIDNGGAQVAIVTAQRQRKIKSRKSASVTLSVSQTKLPTKPKPNKPNISSAAATAGASRAKIISIPSTTTTSATTSTHTTMVEPTKPVKEKIKSARPRKGRGGRSLRQKVNTSPQVPVPVSTSQNVLPAAPETNEMNLLKQQMENERTSMLRALSEAQKRGDALAEHLESQQRQLREIRAQLLEKTNENQYVTRELDILSREASAMRNDVLTLSENDKKLTTENLRYQKNLESTNEILNSMMITSGSISYVNKEVLSALPTLETLDNNNKKGPGNMESQQQKNTELLFIRLKVAEHISSLRHCYCAFATRQTGQKAQHGAGIYPKDLRLKTQGAQDLLKNANIPSKTFSVAMGIQLLSSILLLSHQKSKSKSTLPFAASTGVSFPLFITWLIQLSQIRYRRFELSAAERFHKLVVNNIEIALKEIHLSNDEVKEKWG